MPVRTYNTYPAEFRESSAKLALESEQPMSQTARELGVSAKNLYSWVSTYSGTGEKSRPAKVIESDEIKRLKKELSRVTLERDILKKAAAYFAREAMLAALVLIVNLRFVHLRSRYKNEIIITPGFSSYSRCSAFNGSIW